MTEKASNLTIHTANTVAGLIVFGSTTKLLTILLKRSTLVERSENYINDIVTAKDNPAREELAAEYLKDVGCHAPWLIGGGAIILYSLPAGILQQAAQLVATGLVLLLIATR